MFEPQFDAFHQYLIVEKGLAQNTRIAYLADLQRFCTSLQQRSKQPFHMLTQ